MKKYLAILGVLAAVAMTAGCSSTSKTSSSESSTATSAQTENTDTTQAETTESEVKTEPASTKTTAVTSAKTTAATSTTAATTTVTTTASAKAVYQYNSDGAVEFSGDPSAQSDDTLIAAAQALYDSACNQQYRFTVGSPYSLDHEKYVENDLGWQFYLVLDQGVNSMADVAADYDKVFSKRYNSAIEDVFMESGGRVYCLDGQRGSNIFYSYSQVVSVDRITDDEIFFTVKNYYDPTDITGEAPYTHDATFSAVIEDGVWKAGQFQLPY